MGMKIRARAVHALIAFLLSAGLIMPLLGVMDPSLFDSEMLILSAAVIIVLEAACLHRVSLIAVAGAGLAGLLAWLTGSGSRIMSDYVMAMTLRMQGIQPALPLIAGEAMRITTIAMTVICFTVTIRRATCLPSLLLCIGVALMTWFSERQDLLPWMLPALSAVLTLILITRNEETPAIRVLPWAALITVLAFLLGGGCTEVPALKNKADDIRQAIMDRLFFTEARDVFSLYAVGYSPQGQDQLGGKPNPESTPVMQVSTPRTTYLRGTIYDTYTGRSWGNTAGGRRYLWQSGRMETNRHRLFDQGLPPDSIQNSLSGTETIRIRLLNESPSTLFVPQRVRELIPGADLVPYFSDASEIFITRNLRDGDTYTVRAPLFTSDDAGIGALLDLCAAKGDTGWEDVPEIYTALPDHLEQSVYDLARKITAGISNPYEKAAAIQNWLRNNCHYTLDVSEQPENIDFVTMFLFQTRKGYCTYFASAMTVLCRMAGLPARYVEGYLAEPAGGGEALVTGENAHAWTEVCFKGFGWLTFDATPKTRNASQNSQTPDNPSAPDVTPSPDPMAESENATPTPETDHPNPTPEPEPTNPPDSGTVPPQGSDSDYPDSSGSGGFPWLILLAILLLTALAVRITATSPVLREKRAGSEEKKAEIWIQEVFDLFAAENLTRQNGESLIAFTRRIDRTGPFSTSAEPVGKIVSVLRYSAMQPGQEDTDFIRDTAVLLKSELSRPGHFRYWIRRVFLPASRRNWSR